MSDKFPVVTVCGSMRYFDKMIDVANEMSKDGYIVLMPFVAYILPGEQENNTVKEILDEMNYAKIDMSEAIVVVGEHRGKSTPNEINYARQTCKKIIEYA